MLRLGSNCQSHGEAEYVLRMTGDRTYNVLFLCTGNSARSIMAESLLREIGNGRFIAYSAGSQPKGQVHPKAMEVLKARHLPTEGLYSKAWDVFAKPDAPPMDFVITVCDNAAGEVCPIWPGHPMTAHWGIPDPAAVESSEEAQLQAFRHACQVLAKRVRLLASLPLETLDRLALERTLADIGRLPS
jgi:arsenate reductase (thioredoxin)